MFPSAINLRERLRRGDSLWGAGLPEAAHLLTKLTVNSGVDFLWIDTEHSTYGMEALEMIPVMARTKGCAPIVRVESLDSGQIKRALDLGGSGIMVPQINTAEEARLAVQYAKYPPLGTRGVSPIWPLFLDVDYADYLPHANDETAVVVQVESVEGIKNLEAIAQVEDVDVVFAGPSDLAAALGHIGHPEHPEVQKFLHDFPARVARFGKQSGIAVRGFDDALKSWKQGYRFIVIGHVYHYGFIGLSEQVSRLRAIAAAPALSVHEGNGG